MPELAFSQCAAATSTAPASLAAAFGLHTKSLKPQQTARLEYQAQGGFVAFTITQHAGWVRRDHVRSRAIDLLTPALGTTTGDGDAFGSLSPCTSSAAARQKADECDGARCTHPHECHHLRKIFTDTVPHDNGADVVEISLLNARSKGYLARRFLLTSLMLFSSSSPFSEHLHWIVTYHKLDVDTKL